MSKTTAIVLAAGRGKRMHSDVAKQFMDLEGRPLICYALQTFEKSTCIDEIILVTNEEALEFCKTEIVDRYHFTKVKQVIAGGAERYDSVYAGLCAISKTDYVFIHDGARPFITEEDLEHLLTMVEENGACVAAMPVKDTIKIVDDENCSVSTPNRKTLWQIQTPQVFDFRQILDAYRAMMDSPHDHVTDDAMVMEAYGNLRVKMCPASYRNMKVTTPEDLLIARAFLTEKNTEKI